MFKFGKFRDNWQEASEAARGNFKRTISSGKVRIFLFLALMLNFFLWLYAKYILSVIDEPLIALHYNIDSGIDFYGRSAYIYAVPLTGLIILFFNFLLMLITSRNKDREFMSYILLSACLFANLILLVSLRIIYLINFR